MTQILNFKKRPMATKLKPYQLDICQTAVELKLLANERIDKLIKKEADENIVDPFMDLSHDLMKFLKRMRAQI